MGDGDGRGSDRSDLVPYGVHAKSAQSIARDCIVWWRLIIDLIWESEHSRKFGCVVGGLTDGA